MCIVYGMMDGVTLRYVSSGMDKWVGRGGLNELQ